MSAEVYTKTGDKGMTSLYTGERYDKDSTRVSAYGTIDELQACLGVARAQVTKEYLKEDIKNIERSLWLLMADVSSLGVKEENINITEAQVEELERIIDAYDEKLEPLSVFILPGDSPTATALHVARTVARRAERLMWTLVKEEPDEVHMSNLRYLNRLSDLCYMLGRVETEL